MYEKLNIIRFKSKFCLSSKTVITSATLVAADRRSRDTVCSSLLNGSVTDNMSQRQKIVRMKSLQHMACISQLALIEESRSSHLETIVRLFTSKLQYSIVSFNPSSITNPQQLTLKNAFQYKISFGRSSKT